MPGLPARSARCRPDALRARGARPVRLHHGAVSRADGAG
jgi:hypothetical protein